jgi:hypothetical protein
MGFLIFKNKIILNNKKKKKKNLKIIKTIQNQQLILKSLDFQK